MTIQCANYRDRERVPVGIFSLFFFFFLLFLTSRLREEVGNKVKRQNTPRRTDAAAAWIFKTVQKTDIVFLKRCQQGRGQWEGWGSDNGPRYRCQDPDRIGSGLGRRSCSLFVRYPGPGAARADGRRTGVNWEGGRSEAAWRGRSYRIFWRMELGTSRVSSLTRTMS